MPPEAEELHALRSDVASLKATQASQADHIARIDSWLQRISEDIRKKPPRNDMPVYIALITGVSVLMTLGTFALTPVQNSVKEVKEQIADIRLHDADGHPQKVEQQIHSLDKIHTRERESIFGTLQRSEDRMDKLEQAVAVLYNIADERTKRFTRTLEQRDKMSEIRSGDRWTGSEEQVYQEQHQLLHELERAKKGGGRGRPHAD